jgi:hypothetical protein
MAGHGNQDNDYLMGRHLEPTPKDSSAAGQELPPLPELPEADGAAEIDEGPYRGRGSELPHMAGARVTSTSPAWSEALVREYAKDYARAALAQRDAGEVPVAQAFWVVERFEDGRSAGYWDGANSRSFQADIAAAVQFCRQQDATRATRGWHWTDTKVVEHAYIGTHPAPAGEPTGKPCGEDAWCMQPDCHKCHPQASQPEAPREPLPEGMPQPQNGSHHE